MFVTYQPAFFSRTLRTKVTRTDQRRRKSVSERLRFTSSTAEFMAAISMTGCRRNTSSRQSTTRAATQAPRRSEMDIKTVILAIPFSIVARYLATKAGAQIIARWPVLQGILPWARLKENIMLKINFIETPSEERWILHGRLTDAWVHELRRCWKKHH